MTNAAAILEVGTFGTRLPENYCLVVAPVFVVGIPEYLRDLEVQYLSLNSSYTTRFLITDLVRSSSL